jgi:hypothetical protein
MAGGSLRVLTTASPTSPGLLRFNASLLVQLLQNLGSLIQRSSSKREETTKHHARVD